MLQNVLDGLKRIFGIEPKKTAEEQATEAKQQAAYEDIEEINITAMAVNKVANIVCGDSTIEVTGDGPRAEYMKRVIERVADRLRVITAQALGAGGLVLKPYNVGTELYADLLAQTLFAVAERRGEVITQAYFVADVQKVKQQEYVRLEYHTLAEDGLYTIENRAVRDGTPVPLTLVPAWAEVPEVMQIAGVKQMLFAFVKSPVDNRRGYDNYRGVPLTYGQEKIISHIVELLNEIPVEYRNKKAFIGVEDQLFSGNNELPKDGLYKLFRATGSMDKPSFWEVFSPEIRQTSYFEGVNFWLGLLEKGMGVNQGILTDLETADATATAIKRSTFDTFNLVAEMRKNLEAAFEQLAYALDVYATYFGFAPRGDFELSFDWAYTLLENSQETFNQLMQAQAAGDAAGWEVRKWLFDLTDDEAKETMPQLQDDQGLHGE